MRSHIGAVLALSLAPAYCLAQQAISSSPALWTHASTNSGHPEFEVTGPAPTLAPNCGVPVTGVSPIMGNDVVGRVVVGANPGAACTLTFVVPWPNPPVCDVWNETTGLLPVFPQPQAATLSIAPSAGENLVQGEVLAYKCMGFNTTTNDPTISPDGTILLPGASGNLVTIAGTWTFGAAVDTKGGSQVLLGNAPPLLPPWYGKQMEVAHGGALYLQGDSGSWYTWNGSAFVSSVAP